MVPFSFVVFQLVVLLSTRTETVLPIIVKAELFTGEMWKNKLPFRLALARF